MDTQLKTQTPIAALLRARFERGYADYLRQAPTVADLVEPEFRVDDRLASLEEVLEAAGLRERASPAAWVRLNLRLARAQLLVQSAARLKRLQARRTREQREIEQTRRELQRAADPESVAGLAAALATLATTATEILKR